MEKTGKMMKKNFKIFGLAIASLFLFGCSTVQTSYNSKNNSKVLTNKPQKHLLMSQYNQWAGTKYKYGGTTKKGVDCSAFVGHVYRDAFNINLPRTTTDLIKEGKYVKREDLKAGDMVFFRKGKHVGIYLGNNQFMHSSTKNGVVISDLDKGYYAKVYHQARRLN
jgi:probable lipoprotein nlpC homolog